MKHSARSPVHRTGLLPALVACLGLAACFAPPGDAPEEAAADTLLAFPGAQGWAAATPGGRGGRLLRVTTLQADGPGSLAEALRAEGPRNVVFEVGGVIDLRGAVLSVEEPYVTIAGQTAPGPGITLIRGGLAIRTHDVVVRHLRVRPGEAGHAKESGWEIDGIATTAGARDVIVDHCSITWATDENLSASGPRFQGDDVEAWQAGTSRRITFSNNIVAEGLSRSTHAKGEHSKGSLIHDNATGIAVVGNLYAHNVQRNPYFKGGARGLVVNNLIVNPGNRAVHYRLVTTEWEDRPHATGRIALVGNVLQYGLDTREGVALFEYVGPGALELFADDNLAFDRTGEAAPLTRLDPEREGPLTRLDTWTGRPRVLTVLPASAVRASVLEHAGARPWDRDAVDRRIVEDVRTGTGRIIDSEQDVGGYPAPDPVRRPFDPGAWDLRTMEPLEPPR